MFPQTTHTHTLAHAAVKEDVSRSELARSQVRAPTPTGQSGIFKLGCAVKGAEDRDCGREGVCFLWQSGGRGGATRLQREFKGEKRAERREEERQETKFVS